MPRNVLFTLLLTGVLPLFASDLPRPAALEPAVAFWTRIYTEVDTNAGLIHDAENLEVVYQVMRFSEDETSRNRSKAINYAKDRIEDSLRILGQGKRENLTSEEQRILDLWPQGVSNRTLLRATQNIRFQLGQANKYRAGLIRSGQWRDYIHNVFTERDLPPELALLPHVESSFNPGAYSKVGAAGLWQFTPSTGRRYLRVDHIVDERMDVFKATRAAASLLSHNYAVTGTWPLAITSYNHGAAGMRRASHILGTTDIATIIQQYKSSTFGFASRNFYTAFLAATDVDKNAKKHFGDVSLMQPISPAIFQVPNFIPAAQLSRAIGIDLATLQETNPALRPAVWRGAKHIPKDFHIYLPADAGRVEPNQILAALPEQGIFDRQKADLFHVVQRGNTLSQIASRYRINVEDLMAVNGLRNTRQLRVGQKLRLPQSGETIAAADKPKAEEVALAETKTKPESKPEVPFTGVLYTVRQGDTVYSIAKKFGVGEQELLALNNLPSRHRIFAGQSLKVNTTAEALAQAETTAAVPAVKSAKETDTKPTATLPLVIAQVEIVKPAVQTTQKPPVVSAAENVAADKPAETGEKTDAESTIEMVKQDQIENQEVENAEPISDKEDSVTPGTPAASHTQLAADPSDYEIADNQSIEVQAEETLGHYAEWLDLRASRLRQINKMRYGTQLTIGQRLKLDFSLVKPDEFLQRRIAYHRGMQEVFFSQYHISEAKEYMIRRGETLWVLTNKKFKIPVWLLRQHNPDIDFANLHPNTKIIVPVLEENDTPAESQSQPEEPQKKQDSQGIDASA